MEAIELASVLNRQTFRLLLDLLPDLADNELRAEGNLGDKNRVKTLSRVYMKKIGTFSEL